MSNIEVTFNIVDITHPIPNRVRSRQGKSFQSKLICGDQLELQICASFKTLVLSCLKKSDFLPYSRFSLINAFIYLRDID
jgi:hypothetical protein